LGGIIREGIIRLKHGVKKDLKDIDILFDDLSVIADIFGLMKGFSGISYNRFGNILWTPEEGVLIEIVPFSQKMNFPQKMTFEPTIQNIISTCDITSSAFGYSSKRKEIYSCGGIEAIDSKTLDLLKAESNPSIVMTRIILQHHKLNFSIGPNATRYIQEHYTDSCDEEIYRYLEYKDNLSMYNTVCKSLRKLSRNSTIGCLLPSQTYLSPEVSFGN